MLHSCPVSACLKDDANPRLKNYQGVYFSTPTCCSMLMIGKTFTLEAVNLEKKKSKQKKFSPKN